MIVQDRRILLQPFWIEFLDGEANRLMQAFALLTKQRVVCDLARQHMPEAVLRLREDLRLLDDLLSLKYLQ